MVSTASETLSEIEGLGQALGRFQIAYQWNDWFGQLWTGFRVYTLYSKFNVAHRLVKDCSHVVIAVISM